MAHAIEAALDGRDQWLVAQTADAAITARDAFEDLEGRVNVLCAEEVSPLRSMGVPPMPSPVSEDVACGPGMHGREAQATEAADDWTEF